MTEFILDLIHSWGYFGIAVLMFLENVFPPIPSEVIMSLGGVMVGQGRFDYWTLVAFAVAGTTLGNWVWYWIGRWYGYERLKPLVDRYGRWLTLDWDEVEKLHDWFIRYGSGIVFVMRFMPIARTMVSLPAGMVAMNQAKFLIWTAAGSTIWIAALAGAGSWFGRQFAEVERFIGPVALVAIGSIILLYIYRVVTWKPKVRED
ncbi:DedA family protein [Sphingopyxis alaskensis]|jgi:membrane protein DedA with SNARE-associated domain|uniref:Alkaline phosphatase-like protein n=1 Tax=Sphingopyxis alaskensis (strain DSM 13593 / LMG 18877 / RB2256) TaxID=317655 RepID=Q1GWI9_SPHAL|nr:DedA family protein [Sphingopyxis alaskensis]ABF51983.1 alkaline phosphatase-like protein [Sphingopyxis alaskensis RB2256]MCM3419325.1 DedA family protein [Sphingopyxis alaskensis]